MAAWAVANPTQENPRLTAVADLAANALSNQTAMQTLHEGFAGSPLRRFFPTGNPKDDIFETPVLNRSWCMFSAHHVTKRSSAIWIRQQARAIFSYMTDMILHRAVQNHSGRTGGWMQILQKCLTCFQVRTVPESIR